MSQKNANPSSVDTRQKKISGNKEADIAAKKAMG